MKQLRVDSYGVMEYHSKSESLKALTCNVLDSVTKVSKSITIRYVQDLVTTKNPI